MSPTIKTSAVKNPATEKARKAVLAEISKRLNEPTPATAPKPNATTANGANRAKGSPKDATKRAPAAQGPTSGAMGQTQKGQTAAKPAKLGALDAAAKILAESKTPMRAVEIYAAIEAAGLWKTLGKTPEATIYAAMIREIAAKGKDSRFKKADRGMFTATGKGG
ncbi:MAG: winged helix-turn-helix domain-containing protein [Planctomycetes bacterium]|nr:winged helix-turn-helix domain-containing protein [Planctomycetota bacterium]